jgi:hypothetical protein
VRSYADGPEVIGRDVRAGCVVIPECLEEHVLREVVETAGPVEPQAARSGRVASVKALLMAGLSSAFSARTRKLRGDEDHFRSPFQAAATGGCSTRGTGVRPAPSRRRHRGVRCFYTRALCGHNGLALALADRVPSLVRSADHYCNELPGYTAGPDLGRRPPHRRRVNVAAHACGISIRAFELAISYAQQRETFGKPIAQRQAIACQLDEMATKVEASHALMVNPRDSRTQPRATTSKPAWRSSSSASTAPR